MAPFAACHAARCPPLTSPQRLGNSARPGARPSGRPWLGSELRRRAGLSHAAEEPSLLSAHPADWIRREELPFTFCSSVLSNASTFSCSLRRLAWYAACSCWALPLTCAISALALEKHRFLSCQALHRKGWRAPKDGLHVNRGVGRAGWLSACLWN